MKAVIAGNWSRQSAGMCSMLPKVNLRSSVTTAQSAIVGLSPVRKAPVLSSRALK